MTTHTTTDTTTDTAFDWRSFLARWSEEWADAHHPGELDDEADEAALRRRWLGSEPVPAARITALEERLGRRLPPSYRGFLEVADGWRCVGDSVWVLCGSEGVRWHEDALGMTEAYADGEDDQLAGMWARALELDVESDMTWLLLDPGDVDGDGEWAVYVYKGWAGECPDRYASFWDYMQARYREFHASAANRPEGREFDNATTRALDASVEQARRDALRGDWERAEAALAEAASYGRPGAWAMHEQIIALREDTRSLQFAGLACDPVYAAEVVPVLAAAHVERHRHVESRRDKDAWWLQRFMQAPDVVQETGREVLRQMREGAYRYAAAGSFGRAVEAAREQARWGETDAAWRTLTDALPGWQPVGPDHIAPVGLLADRVLGPLLTPERCRELLATPRGGESGDVPAPAPDLDPGGLAWLTEPDPRGWDGACRFVLVEGAAPGELPAHLADDGDQAALLHDPMDRWEAEQKFRVNRPSSTYDDKALTAVGRAGPGWSFAFDARPNPFNEQRFTSPAAAASRGTRAVVVWCEPARPDWSPGYFHLSVAVNGEERYAFTALGSEIRRSGAIPPALAPDRFSTSGQWDERAALEAIAAEFGVSLPRFALTEGRLHGFTTRSWTRQPGPGEAYVVMGFGPLTDDADPPR
ncbi:SMI1/KNR4 family protein [Streptomyces sp. MUM 178J]|uniref:SMI1/KNR4 family protein n=1 Tax=Streptomyces sp. MUM 178J TaxID=2791991 RepID=UPI001F046F62|nr:SMI1/KNR4 family protein [Streptomyces sp. MUM 178J]WRQ82406.1 SMI1/KNR4 family protein [Streptomyces sp. MUM 178J]